MSSGFASLQEWLYKDDNAKQTPPTDDPPPAATLLDMGGGKHWIKEDRYAEFLQVYASCIYRQVRNAPNPNERGISLAECRGERFRYFVDFDIAATAPWRDEDYAALARTVIDVVRRFLDPLAPQLEALLGVVMATAPPVQKADGRVKVGVHVTFDKLIVDKEMALRMREVLIVAFERDFCEMLGHPTTEQVRDIIDASVYRQNVSGLRMLGSAKVTRCATCATLPAEERKTCLKCMDRNGKGWRHGKNFLFDRIYTIHGIFNADGTEAVSEFLVNEFTEEYQLDADIAALPNGANGALSTSIYQDE